MQVGTQVAGAGLVTKQPTVKIRQAVPKHSATRGALRQPAKAVKGERRLGQDQDFLPVSVAP